jgi:3-hydroxyisobutyrate dehydrogenase-like beta-hydroxyacid dehydrogenase
MSDRTIGFVGLGVMGEPMCRNLLRKSGRAVLAFDLAPAPLARIGAEGAAIAGSLAEVAARSEVVMLCLPGGPQVREVCEGEAGLLAQARGGQVVVDLGTSPVALARELARRLAERGAGFADAPIARTRAAAEAGTLSVMVGAAPETFARIEPLLRCFATDIAHCGGPGCGQVVKILNNMVLFETVNALAEAVAVGRRAGVAPALLLETLSKGSADSFALRNHGLEAIVPDLYPERAFSTEYALKDLSYALELAAEAGLRLRGAELAGEILREAIEAGFGANYWPVIAKIVDRA